MATLTRQPRPFRWNRKHLDRFPEDTNRYEVLNGRLMVTPLPPPAHAIVATDLKIEVGKYARAAGVGVGLGPGAVIWGQNELRPDFLVTPIKESEVRDAEWETVPLPILVFEVISPGSQHIDRYAKRDAYLALGIPTYWVVDIDESHVEVSTPGSPEPVIVRDVLTWQPNPSVPAQTINLAELFA